MKITRIVTSMIMSEYEKSLMKSCAAIPFHAFVKLEISLALTRYPYYETSVRHEVLWFD